MSKKENTTKSFVLRVDAATMNAIEAWAAVSSAPPTDSYSGLSTRRCAKAEG